MKTLKFKPHLCEQILSGEKTSTWRLFDDKNLQEGDTVKFLNKETLNEFGTATLDTIAIKTLGTLEEGDWGGVTSAMSLKRPCMLNIENITATKSVLIQD